MNDTDAPAADMGPDVVTVTDSAAERARQLLARSAPAGAGLRVRVHSAGCEGFVAVLDIAALPLPDEIVVVCNGVPLFADIASMLELPGATLDHRKTAHGAEFVWSHPAATGLCGCAEPAHATDHIQHASAAATT